MKKTIIAFILAVLPGLGFASSEHLHLDHANIDPTDKASLQRGAKLFVNYCLNCHSANFMRYNRMGADLGISDELVKKNLLFTADKVGAQMQIAMRKEDAKHWFGTPPPDLSVIARSKGPGSEGADWLYTYLRSFYVDDSRPFGMNNTVFKDVGMPHVLWQLQGEQRLVNPEYEEKGVSPQFELVTPGTMTPEEYDQAARDIANYLVYMGEPSKMQRQSLGIWVLLFLVVLFVVSYAMKKEYWKDVH